MFSSTTSTHEKIWLDKSIYDLAEKKYYEKLARPKGNSSFSCKEQKTEAFNQQSPKKCFVGLEKDGTGTIKAPEKVWVDKLVYDLAEKEYYEKLEKSRLFSNDKDVNVQEQIVTEVDTNVREKDEVVDSIFDENDVKLVNISDIVIDERTPTIDISINEIEGKNSDEKTASELLNEFIADELPISPIKSVTKITEITKNEDDSSQILSPELTDEEDKTKSSPVLRVENQVINVQNIDEQIEKQVNSSDKNIKLSDDKHSQTERLGDSKESLLFQETHESSKQQKFKVNEQLFMNDTVGIKRKASDEKKVQDSTVKLQKGAQNPHKKSNISPPKNKSTNVNTIPAFPKMTATVNGLSLKINKGNDFNKNNSPSTQTSQIDVKVIETVPVIKPRESLPNTNTDETQTKKETKKNKKNKKRHRDEKSSLLECEKRNIKMDKSMKGVTQNANTWNSLAGEVAKARQHIKNSLQCIDDIASITSNNVIVEVNNRINTLEMENTQMKQRVKELTDLLSKFEERLANIEKNSKPTETVTSRSVASGSSAKLPTQHDEDEDDGVDLFASDSEEENAEATKIKEQRLAEYAAKKSKKPAIIAKSSIVLDVKPWDDTTDMKRMEEEVRKIKTDGLLWGASKLVPLAYGIHKLQISCVVEDEKVSVDWLQETIETIEDYVQSVDIAAFNKI